VNREILLGGPSALSAVRDEVDWIRGKYRAILIDETCTVVILQAAVFGCEAENPRIDCVNASVLLLLTGWEREGLRLM